MFFGIFVLNRVSNLSFFVLIRVIDLSNFVLNWVKCLKQGIKNRNSVLKWVGKSAIFVLNRARVWGAAPHLPTQGYIDSPPPPPGGKTGQFFQVSMLFHLSILAWLHTTKNSFSALQWSLATKLQNYFSVGFHWCKKSFSGLKFD